MRALVLSSLLCTLLLCSSIFSVEGRTVRGAGPDGVSASGRLEPGSWRAGPWQAGLGPKDVVLLSLCSTSPHSVHQGGWEPSPSSPQSSSTQAEGGQAPRADRTGLCTGPASLEFKGHCATLEAQ